MSGPNYCLIEDKGKLTSNGHNLESENSGQFTAPSDRIDTEPLLGPLAGNRGPTKTHALLAGSPAIDAGDPAACPGTDQRRVARLQNGDGPAARSVTSARTK